MSNKQRVTGAVSRREVLKYGLYGGLAAITPALWVSGCAGLKKSKRPNVLLIVLDTARVDRFSCMGYERNTSPNIDSIFSEGVIYDNAYSTACWTLPSHASLFTGLYPIQAGATSETLQLPAANITLAQALAEAGYDTIGFNCNGWLSLERGFAKGFEKYNEMWREQNRPDITQSKGPIEVTATQWAIQWLEKRKKQHKPFFMFINLNCIHLPYLPPEPFLSRFVGNKGYNNEEVNRVAAIKSWWQQLAGKLKLSKRDYRILSDLYDGEVGLADRCVGQIVHQLKTSGILDDTLLIVTSDHGENLGEHGRIDHNLSLHETTLHIPLMMRYPPAFKPATRVDDFVSIVDIAPTILDLCRQTEAIEKIKPTQTSLARNDRKRRAFIIAANERPLNGIGLMKERYPEFDTTAIDYRLRAIRTNPYKLIWTVNKGTELFDLNADPGETHNLAGREVEVQAKLSNLLKSWANQIPSAKDISLMKSQDTESLEILRSLGYIK